MKVIADFHLHSKYSRATSKQMDIENLAAGAKLKGLNLLGTSDFTHPLWLKELKRKLNYLGNGIYEYDKVYFVLTTEVATYFEKNGKQKRVHHVIHAPDFETVQQINEQLAKFGDLKADGRPILKISAAELVEILKKISKAIFVYPAHAWTPWMSCLGSKSGFDSVEACYEDQVKHIHALETGLSSDPPMNWRVSELDQFTLVSNSDSHSPWPWRLGREANVFELKKLSYKELHDAIIKKDKKRFLFTIEVPPSYGKYHFTGHRACNVSMHPKEAMRIKNICPVCGKKLNIGVLQRVEELADRPEGYKPKNAIPYKSLLPLYEILSFSMAVNQLYSKKVLALHDKLIKQFGSELNVLLNVSKEQIEKVANQKIADAIIKVREGKISFIPGYDGVYGKPVFNHYEQKISSKQKLLHEF